MEVLPALNFNPSVAQSTSSASVAAIADAVNTGGGLMTSHASGGTTSKTQKVKKTNGKTKGGKNKMVLNPGVTPVEPTNAEVARDETSILTLLIFFCQAIACLK